jgi:hypothetical protein
MAVLNDIRTSSLIEVPVAELVVASRPSLVTAEAGRPLLSAAT